MKLRQYLDILHHAVVLIVAREETRTEPNSIKVLVSIRGNVEDLTRFTR